MTNKETAASWLVKQGPDSELAQRLASSCDTPDIDLSWVFPIIARSLLAKRIADDLMTNVTHDEFVAALKFIKKELAALIPDPTEVSIDTWPLPSSADRFCIDAAWRKVIYILDKAAAPAPVEGVGEDKEWKSCPFCGGEDIRCTRHSNTRYNDPDHYPSKIPFIYSMCCYQCGATFPNRYRKELLIEAWNRRVPAPQAENVVGDEVVERVARALCYSFDIDPDALSCITNKPMWLNYRMNARAALAAIHQEGK